MSTPPNTTNAKRLYSYLKSHLYWHSMKELAEALKCSEREIRSLVNEINTESADNSFDHVIVTGNKGYKMAETREEIIETCERIRKMALTMLQRVSQTEKKMNKHGQQMLKTSEYHRTEFRAMMTPEELEKQRDKWEEQKARM